MHSYAVDSDQKKPFTFYIALLSFIIVLVAPHFAGRVGIPHSIVHLSAMPIFGGLWTLFDKYVWKLSVAQKTFVKVPNLNGTWNGLLTTSFDGHESRRPVSLQIEQTWTRISIHFTSEQSRSHSVNASIMVENASAVVLSYEYLNEPNNDAAETMNIHRGFTRLYLSHSRTEFEGDYFTGRERISHGTLHFRKSEQ